MELRHLRYFVAVAEEGHFGRAAERLHIVQPALSMQIRALEDELGGPLLIRTSRRVQLTYAGTILLAEAKRTLAQAEHSKQSAQRALLGQLGRVRVGYAGNAIMSGPLINDLRAFHQSYPDAELIVREMVPQLQADAILAGELDIGYAPTLGERKESPLRSEKLRDWKMMLALSADHPLADKKRLTAKMLVDESFILYSAESIDPSQITLLRHVLGQDPVVGHWVENTLGVLALAAAGLGVALVPESQQSVSIPNLIFRKIAGVDFSLMGLELTYRSEEESAAVAAYLTLACPKHSG